MRTPALFIQKCLNRGEKGWDFCCVDHRRQMVETHVALETRNMPIQDEVVGDLRAPDPRGCEDDGDPEASPIVGLTADQVLRLRTFFENWIRMTPAQRDVAALALCGLNGAEIGRRRNCSKQAVSMRLAAARERSPALTVAIPPVERPGTGTGDGKTERANDDEI